MNQIIKRPIHDIGYGFIDPEYLPKGRNEYHLRNRQNRNGISYRKLTTSEIEMLVRNNNSSDNWNNILVSDAFNPDLVKNCTFFGLVRIGKLESFFLEFKNLRLPVGLYNSTVVSCDFGDNVVIDNVNYMAHYIVGNEVMIVNVNELATTSTAKFGNGIVKQGEKENIRIWLEVCNENGGRAIVPFNGMLPGDAYLWARYRNDEKLLEKFMQFTEKKFDKQRGYYGKIGDRTVIKNCRMIKDVWMGSDIYMKGANKIKNITINSSPEAPTQIGEGCELVNGIIGVGCKVFYGVKAVRFIMASHSQLKYGARLINSYLGNNATISCCEVLNSLIFPFHEQHHNNSFLCASLVEGQSNMAAGATIGSNHNSRSADGEILAGRGFWPGLSVSLKHNSRFATFTIINKGAYPAELDIKIPFCLISDDVPNNRLVVVPGYWFMYNLYALTRNEWKYGARDLRTEKVQRIETSYLAPDSVNEMFSALELMREFTGRAWYREYSGEEQAKIQYIKKGRALLDSDDPVVDDLEILAPGFENSDRKVVLMKVKKAYEAFTTMIRFYGITKLVDHLQSATDINEAVAALPQRPKRNDWVNIGGQLIPQLQFESFRKSVHAGRIKDWDDVHAFYEKQSSLYDQQVFEHALASLKEITGIRGAFEPSWLVSLLKEGVKTMKWISAGIYESRQKDYENPFRLMVYENEAEMEKVVGKLEENSFILLKQEETRKFGVVVNRLIRKISSER
ncbi:MAG TPA: DUF4954 family protein [Chitinophagaceae bacterium]|nr:DUF4954 family protein [Chitinophagaceae bacterium]